jgi:hypothetical protein
MATPTNVSYAYSGARIYAGKARPSDALAGAAAAQAAATAAIALGKAMAASASGQGGAAGSLTVTSGAGASFSWTAVSGAARYDVGWDSSSHSAGDRNDPTLYPNLIDVGSATSYSNTQGVPTYAAVRSVDSNGEVGPWSSEVSLSP